MNAEQRTVPEAEQSLVGLGCPIRKLIEWENLFSDNLPLPTEEGDLIRFKSALEKFSSLVRKAIDGEVKKPKERQQDERNAMEAMHLLIPIKDITPRLIRLESGLKAYLCGQPVEEEDRHLIFITVNILGKMAVSGNCDLITTSPVSLSVI